MLALCGRGDEGEVIKVAVELKNKLGANLIVVHVNDSHAGEMSMMMEAPQKFTEEDIRQCFADTGYEKESKEISVKILKDESTSKILAMETENIDLLILGHRKQNVFKEHFFDSIDEGIVNLSYCPVMVVQKK